jgi:peptidoglycan/LPS O-acetylase OafA/YrhL
MRLNQLDSVRALAIGAVMVEHFGGATLNSYIPIGMGSIGVGCFFALSGYLITSSLLVEFDRAGGPKAEVWYNFYIRRFLRLIPAFYLWLAVLYFLKIEPIPSSWAWHASYLSNVWIALGNPILDFWSLAVEEQFYIFWPFVIAFVPRAYLPHAIIGITIVGVVFFKAICASLGISPKTIQTLLFSNMMELGVGAFLALKCYRNGKPYQFDWYNWRARTFFAILSATCIAVAILSWYVVGKTGPYRYYFNDLICAIPFAWLILHASIGFKGIVGAFFENKFVRYIGQISYGIYLTHNFMPQIVEKFLGPMPKYQAAPIVLIATFVICTLSWFFIEKPILRLKKHFELTNPVTGVETPAATQVSSELKGVLAPTRSE